MIRILLVLSLVTLGPPLSAQTADDIDPEVYVAARAYLEAFPIEQLWNEMADAFLAIHPAEDRDQLERMFASVDLEEMEAVTLDLLMRHFTAAELHAMAEFYGSPEGRSIMQKMPAYMADLQPYLMRMLDRMMDSVFEDLFE